VFFTPSFFIWPDDITDTQGDNGLEEFEKATVYYYHMSERGSKSINPAGNPLQDAVK
jgi:hypothetical protein